MAIGDSRIRVDAYAKVTGEAKYVADLQPKHAYVAKIVRATIANGIVTGFDLDAARAVPGVIAVYTCFDVPDRVYPTAAGARTLCGISGAAHAAGGNGRAPAASGTA